MATALIVDDTKLMRLTLRDILTGMGIEVVGEAVNGIEAVEKTMQLKPDLVTLDIIMPELDGIEALKAIMDINPDQCVCMVSSLGMDEEIKRALLLGADSYIIKPFEAKTVVETIESILD